MSQFALAKQLVEHEAELVEPKLPIKVLQADIK